MILSHLLNYLLRVLLWFLQVTRTDYLSGRTALHFAAVNGHVRCIRLAVADFVPSGPYESLNAQSERSDGSNTKMKSEQRFVLLFCPS